MPSPVQSLPSETIARPLPHILWRPSEISRYRRVSSAAPEGSTGVSNSQTSRTTHQKLAIFRSCFAGLEHVYGTYDPKTGRSHQVKQPVSDKVLLYHLQGRQPYGVYLLVGDQIRAVAADFDDEDTLWPLEFIRQARQYGIKAYIERSKRKGWHAWIFAELPGVSAAKARLVVKAILDDIGKPTTEIFPKRDRLNDSTSYGNFINAPLFGMLVHKGRTVFVDPDNGLRPYPNQWDLLESIQQVREHLLDEIIEINNLTSSENVFGGGEPSPSSSDGHFTFGLPPCAQRMFSEGVTEHQRIACFRLALHLKKAGLPQDLAIVSLNAWADKNRPTSNKRIITASEIHEQAKSAYAKDYRGCGCEEAVVMPYCSPNCPLKCNTKVKTETSTRTGNSDRRDSDSHPSSPQ